MAYSELNEVFLLVINLLVEKKLERRWMAEKDENEGSILIRNTSVTKFEASDQGPQSSFSLPQNISLFDENFEEYMQLEADDIIENEPESLPGRKDLHVDALDLDEELSTVDTTSDNVKNGLCKERSIENDMKKIFYNQGTLLLLNSKNKGCSNEQNPQVIINIQAAKKKRDNVKTFELKSKALKKCSTSKIVVKVEPKSKPNVRKLLKGRKPYKSTKVQTHELMSIAQRTKDLKSKLNQSALKMLVKEKKVKQVSRNCPQCLKNFTNNKEYSNHRLICTSNLARHPHAIIDESTGTNRFRCPMCFKTFETFRETNVHKKTHKPLICLVCGKKKTTRRRLQLCVRQHVNDNCEGLDKLFKCLFCSLYFGLEDDLSYHLDVRHHEMNSNPRDFHCSLCIREFTTQNNLERHELVSHDIKRSNRLYEPTLKEKNEKKERKLHPEMFSNKISCHICGKMIEAKCYKSHQNVHNRKKYNCDLCGGLSFNTYSNYRKHKLMVHCNFLKKCKVCSREFRDPGYFKTHIKEAHSGTPNYTCKICGKTFTFGSNYRTHIKRVHEGKPDKISECLICGKGYNRPSLLSKHMQSQHKKK